MTVHMSSHVHEILINFLFQIGEKRIRAHKCILASRCVYFAAMLSGHWVESAGNVIKLQGYVYVSSRQRTPFLLLRRQS